MWASNGKPAWEGDRGHSAGNRGTWPPHMADGHHLQETHNDKKIALHTSDSAHLGMLYSFPTCLHGGNFDLHTQKKNNTGSPWASGDVKNTNTPFPLQTPHLGGAHRIPPFTHPLPRATSTLTAPLGSTGNPSIKNSNTARTALVPWRSVGLRNQGSRGHCPSNTWTLGEATFPGRCRRRLIVALIGVSNFLSLSLLF